MTPVRLWTKKITLKSRKFPRQIDLHCAEGELSHHLGSFVILSLKTKQISWSMFPAVQRQPPRAMTQIEKSTCMFALAEEDLKVCVCLCVCVCVFLLCTKSCSPVHFFFNFTASYRSRLVYVLRKCVFTALYVERTGNDTLIISLLHTDIHTHSTWWLTSDTFLSSVTLYCLLKPSWGATKCSCSFFDPCC